MAGKAKIPEEDFSHDYSVDKNGQVVHVAQEKAMPKPPKKLAADILTQDDPLKKVKGKVESPKAAPKKSLAQKVLTAHEPVKSSLPSTATPVAFFVRHGETDMNAANDFRGDIDVPLNHAGQQQAQQLVYFFDDTLLSHIFNSSRSRTHETLEPLLKAKQMTSTTLPELDNLDTGNFAGLPKNEENLEHMEWYKEHPDAQIPGGDRVRDWRNRVDKKLIDLIELGAESEHPVLACIHGSVIKELSRLLHDNTELVKVEPGGVVGVFKIPAGGYMAKALLKENDVEEILPWGS
jgi:broad specificity phosphatase PhoE